MSVNVGLNSMGGQRGDGTMMADLTHQAKFKVESVSINSGGIKTSRGERVEVAW